MTARRPAVIAADLRRMTAHLSGADLGQANDIVDELDALESRWPTADEIAVARRYASRLRNAGTIAGADEAYGKVVAFLDRLDRLDPPLPEPQADDDGDPWALLAAVVEPVRSGAEMPDRMAAIDAARAALDARGQR